jgi:hypothetical protein
MSQLSLYLGRFSLLGIARLPTASQRLAVNWGLLSHSSFFSCTVIRSKPCKFLLNHPELVLTLPYLSLEIFGFVMLSGVASTLLLPEPRGRSLEELSNENQKGFIRSTLSPEAS